VNALLIGLSAALTATILAGVGYDMARRSNRPLTPTFWLAAAAVTGAALVAGLALFGLPAQYEPAVSVLIGLVFPLALAWMWWSRRRQSDGIGWLLLSIAAAALIATELLFKVY